MPRFFLNLDECGIRSLDQDGFELAHLEAAREAGIKAARDIMASEVRSGKLCLNCRVEVTDADGVVVLVHDEVGAAGAAGIRRVQGPVARDWEEGEREGRGNVRSLR